MVGYGRSGKRGHVTGPPAFFNRTYDETMALLIEARNYVAWHEVSDQRGLRPQIRLQVSFESLRITSRLTQVMAWLLAQKAVHAGELTVEQAAGPDYALDGGDVCAKATESDVLELPTGLRSLLDRSQHLYIRISRLDAQVRRSL
jgi:regulator of CtrA degradation